MNQPLHEPTFTRVKLLLGIAASTTSNREKFIAALGAVLFIYVSQVITARYIPPEQSLILLTSMGASAALVFGLPHGALSQPWNVVIGHIISAIIGIFCVFYIHDIYLACALSVGLSVLFMHYFHCLHPPGSATALFCVMSANHAQQLDWSYIYQPLLLNLGCLVVLGILFNGLFHWRRYPAHLNFRQQATTNNQYHLSQEDFSAALQQVDSFIDVSSEELAVLFDYALTHAEQTKAQNKVSVTTNHCYSNAAIGEFWRVKQVIAINGNMLRYKIIAGKHNGHEAECHINAFKKWAKYEVVLQQKSWLKKLPQ